MLALTVGGLAWVGLTAAAPENLLVYWLVLGGLTLFAFYVVKGDLLTALFVWFLALITLHEEFWRQQLPFFFSLTIPRIGIVLLVALFLAMLALGRIRLRSAWPISGLFLAVAAYFSVSAVMSGFETRSIVSVHYRLIGGYLFPFVVFGLVLHGFQREHDFKRLAVFFALLSVYLTFTGWCEQFRATSLIWPGYISDPKVGIHWGRVRGPFLMSPAMGLALVYCYFNNLMLARNIHRGRWLLYGINAAMLPVLLWTKTRSVWLSFVLAGLVWMAYSRRRVHRVVSVSLLLAAGLLVAVVNMDNFMGTDRSRGGLTDTAPILLRIGLARMSLDMVKQHPFLGVGFGHFRDFGPSFARDPASPFYAFGTTALEHNNLLSILAETGIVGVLLYISLMVVLIRHSVRLFRKLPPRGPGFVSRDMLVLYWILATAYFIDGSFRETSLNPFANSLFFGLSAVPVALDLLLSPQPIRARPGFGPIGSSGLRTSPPAPGDRIPGRSTAPPRRAGAVIPRRAPRGPDSQRESGA